MSGRALECIALPDFAIGSDSVSGGLACRLAAFDKMGSTFNEIADYFRSPASTPLPVVREQAMLLHGGRGTQLLDEIVKVHPGLTKLSRHKQPVITNRLEAADGEVYGLISQFMDELDEYKRLKAAFVETEKQAHGRGQTATRAALHEDRPVVPDDGHEADHAGRPFAEAHRLCDQDREQALQPVENGSGHPPWPTGQSGQVARADIPTPDVPEVHAPDACQHLGKGDRTQEICTDQQERPVEDPR